jgi:hypothetical protein
MSTGYTTLHNLSTTKGSLFVCHIDISQTMVSLVTHGIVAKPLMSRGAPRWFHNVSIYGGEVIKY